MNPKSTYPSFEDAARLICATGAKIYARGWCPATSGNFSVRLSQDSCAITASGMDKGNLTTADIVRVDLETEPLNTGKKPSAETLLHTLHYAGNADVGAILHTHSQSAVVLSRILADRGSQMLECKGYEIQKAFAGIDTHASIVRFPIINNSQDIDALSQHVEGTLEHTEHCYGYLLVGHGLYTWGADLDESWRHLEAMEYLLQCELATLDIHT